ncbi:hypothetical protein ACYATL_06045 [Actinotignum timonense]|uniref:hypothetical protein n=1 Tax=Actinotignum TaxID=1653174 RepID=UPI00254CBB5C|nr:hypothetical protein [Actinotignum timonense]MDK6907377.1 hypothetical protein [Actinotignum timonense]MDK8782932.1 hypothetical protein [Actinotignum timonense]MDY5138918.1 hypothetical protein [Actinotignum timonense]
MKERNYPAITVRHNAVERNGKLGVMPGNDIWGDIAKTAMGNASGAHINCGAQGGS